MIRPSLAYRQVPSGGESSIPGDNNQLFFRVQKYVFHLQYWKALIAPSTLFVIVIHVLQSYLFSVTINERACVLNLNTCVELEPILVGPHTLRAMQFQVLAIVKFTFRHHGEWAISRRLIYKLAYTAWTAPVAVQGPYNINYMRAWQRALQHTHASMHAHRQRSDDDAWYNSETN